RPKGTSFGIGAISFYITALSLPNAAYNRCVLWLRLCLVSLGILVGLGVGTAKADSHSDIETITQLMRELRYEQAIASGLQALRDAKPSDRLNISKIYELLGTAYFLLGDEAHARIAFVERLALNPNAPPPADESPKVRTFFDRIRLEAAGIALD